MTVAGAGLCVRVRRVDVERFVAGAAQGIVRL